MVGILVALVLVLSAGAAGAVFAPRLLSSNAAPKPGEESEEAASEEGDAEHEGEHEEAKDGEAPAEEEKHGDANKDANPGSYHQRAGKLVGEMHELSPIVVDSRAEDGSVRHIKVVLSIEHPKELPAEEFKRLVPFAREAAITYLRTRNFEQLSDPKNFDSLRKELASEIISAVGKKHAKRVLFIDYVVQ